ncbi:FHA domain-containing protein [Microbacterium sp. zg.Y1090]|uniref:FHA domain-containing protein n=1 Tax=Microbacterium wangruii TaxID=3049073 RepID=UPI00214AFEA7|nr:MULTISPECIES: FHA domain-containing protein [unclassified Microbacterium]MCR2818328.1 FHA domain-containing protein [Microbacterium sp. zg.Y1090]WIM29349.1 FHA domain-containing protein [Microbacterium sp. zg-Y1090]
MGLLASAQLDADLDLIRPGVPRRVGDVFSYSVPPPSAAAGFGMVADRFLLMTDATVGEARARDLFQILSASDAALEDVLAALAAPGIEHLPDFALVELVDARTSSVSVAVRGAAAATLHGRERTRISGPGVGTWVEAAAQQVSGMALTLHDGASAASLPLGRGVVRTDRVQWGEIPQAGSVAAPPAPAATAQEAPASDLPAWVGDVGADAAGQTTAFDRDELAALVAAAAPVHQPPRVPHAAAPRRFVLTFDDGRELPLELPVVLGRAPRPSAHPGARLAALPSPRREVSGTHAEVYLEGDQLVVRDLDSTNGTVVRHADGSAMLLRGGAVARLSEGAVLDIGDGNVARFRAAP